MTRFGLSSNSVGSRMQIDAVERISCRTPSCQTPSEDSGAGLYHEGYPLPTRHMRGFAMG